MDTFLSHWDSQGIEVVKLLVAVVGIFGLPIAFCQLNTAKRKLKLDLFEKRLEIYKSTNKFLSFFNLGQKPDSHEELDFLRSVDHSKLLFNGKIYKELSEIYQQGTKLPYLEKEREFQKDEYRLRKNEDSLKKLEKAQENLDKAKEFLLKSQAKINIMMSPFLKLS